MAHSAPEINARRDPDRALSGTRGRRAPRAPQAQRRHGAEPGQQQRQARGQRHDGGGDSGAEPLGRLCVDDPVGVHPVDEEERVGERQVDFQRRRLVSAQLVGSNTVSDSEQPSVVLVMPRAAASASRSFCRPKRSKAMISNPSSRSSATFAASRALNWLVAASAAGANGVPRNRGVVERSGMVITTKLSKSASSASIERMPASTTSAAVAPISGVKRF